MPTPLQVKEGLPATARLSPQPNRKYPFAYRRIGTEREKAGFFVGGDILDAPQGVTSTANPDGGR